MKNVAIQGIYGSFHDEATRLLFPDENIELIFCDRFKDLAQKVYSEEANLGVMAIENSIAGSILMNYNLLDEYNLRISDELYMPINHYWMGLQGQNKQTIKEVRSHPMALMQCENYFNQYPSIKLVEYADTALAAKHIADQQWTDISAIAPKRSAEVYSLEIFGEKIQTIAHNFTRFFVVQKELDDKVNFNKASVKFKVSHQTGSLAKVLNLIDSHHFNISKLQSVPVIEEPWNYAFYADFILPEKASFDSFIEKVKTCTKEIKVLGKYLNKK